MTQKDFDNNEKLMNALWWFILIIVIIGMASCGPAANLRKAEKLIKKAELAGLTWSSDTVFTEVPVFLTETRLDSIIVPLAGDTVVLEKERLSVKIVRLRGDTVFVDVKVPGDTIKINVPTIINREITADCRIKWWWVLIAFLAGVVLGRLVLKMLI